MKNPPNSNVMVLVQTRVIKVLLVQLVNRDVMVYYDTIQRSDET